MRKMRWKLPVIIMTLMALTLLGAPMTVADEASSGEATEPFEAILQQLSDILVRLERKLSALETPPAERLEYGVEEIAELVEGLLRNLEVTSDETPEGVGQRVARLRLMLRQLVSVLESVIDVSTTAQPSAREALADLWIWVDGYLEGVTAGMDDRMADRIETMAHEMVRDLAARLADMLRRAQQDAPAETRLEALTDPLKELIQQMDRLLRRRAAQIQDTT